MCIICYKPKGIELPKDDEIVHMFNRNPDGAGFAVQGWFYTEDENGEIDRSKDPVFGIMYKKGYMTSEALLKALHEIKYPENYNIAIHCRIKTHGEVDEGTCHPFPLGGNYNYLRQTSGFVKFEPNQVRGVLFHNGTFTSLGGKLNKNSSDTQDFVAGVATKYLGKSKMPNELSQAIVNELIGTSRVLVMYPNFNFQTLRMGSWYEHKGCWYSNMGYKQEYTTVTKTTYTQTPDPKEPVAEDTFVPCWGKPWIRYSTLNKLEEIVKNNMEPVNLKGTDESYGMPIYRTKYGTTQYYVDKDNLEIFKDDLLLEWDEYHMKEEYLYGQLGVTPEDEYIQFMDEEEMNDFCQMADVVDDFVYKYNGKEWYLDTVNMEAWTENGIRQGFKTGEQGHIKSQLKKNGAIKDNRKELEEKIEKETANEDHA